MSDSSPNTQAERPNYLGKMVNAVTYPVSAALGFLVTHTSVRDSAYQTAKKTKGFDDITEKFQTRAQANMRQRIEGAISQEEFLSRAIDNKRNHRRAVQARVEELGLGRFSGKWAYINRGNKQKAIIEGLTVSGIAIGAMLTAANSRFLGGEEEEKKR